MYVVICLSILDKYFSHNIYNDTGNRFQLQNKCIKRKI